jgi:flavin reductase (DIM6/NTAB) family NADH-FMN oxidoreductase RutF
MTTAKETAALGEGSGRSRMTAPDPADPSGLRRAYGTFPSGVTAVCAMREGEPVGFAASSFVAVSLEPALVSICVQRTSTTWPLLVDAPRLGLSVLGAGHEEVCRRLASKTGDRFADVPVTATDGGAVLLHEATAWLECSVHEVVPAGDLTWYCCGSRGCGRTTWRPWSSTEAGSTSCRRCGHERVPRRS